MATAHSTSRAGFTLMEVAVTMATFALLTAMVVPRTGGLFSHSAVKAAAGEVAAKFRVAQLSATLGGRTTVVRVSYGRIWVEARPRTVPAFGSTVDTLGSVTDLAMQHKVAVGSGLDSVVYSPNGIAAVGGVLNITRGSAHDSVIVNSLGMVTK